MWVFCCGMQRSGSTLQYQVSAHLVESAGLGQRVDWVRPDEFPELARQNAHIEVWKVFKNHNCTLAMAQEFHSGGARGVYCYRDLRDVFASSLKKWNSSFDSLWGSGFLNKNLDNYQKWTSLPRVLVSKYEEMMADLPNEVSRIASHLDIPLDADAARQVADEYSIDRQRERIELSKQDEDLRAGFGQDRFNPHTLLHTNHIGSAAVGGWRQALAPQEVAVIEYEAEDWLRAHGYELTMSRVERSWLRLRRNAGRLVRKVVGVGRGKA